MSLFWLSALQHVFGSFCLATDKYEWWNDDDVTHICTWREHESFHFELVGKNILKLVSDGKYLKYECYDEPNN